MPITPTHATVPTIASAAFPPFFSNSVPILLQTSLSEATAPNLPSSTVGMDGNPVGYGAWYSGLPKAVCRVNRLGSHWNTLGAIAPENEGIEAKKEERRGERIELICYIKLSQGSTAGSSLAPRLPA